MQSSPLFLIALAAVLIVPIFLQKRRTDKMRAQLAQLHASLTPGLAVITTAGLYAVVDSVDEDARTVDLVVAPGVVSRFDVNAIVRLAPSSEIANSDATAGDTAE